MINHSGGCPGADMTWEIEGRKYGVTSIAYSFHNHVQEGENPKILTIEELAEGFRHVQLAAKGLNRTVDHIPYQYIKNLISRNWFQVKNAECVYAVGTFHPTGNRARVNGGTGWAVQMGIDSVKPVYFFDQDSNGWFKYDYEDGFIPSDEPVLSENFAGVGTRDLNDNGVNAIRSILKKTFDQKG